MIQNVSLSSPLSLGPLLPNVSRFPPKPFHQAPGSHTWWSTCPSDREPFPKAFPPSALTEICLLFWSPQYTILPDYINLKIRRWGPCPCTSDRNRMLSPRRLLVSIHTAFTPQSLSFTNCPATALHRSQCTYRLLHPVPGILLATFINTSILEKTEDFMYQLFFFYGCCFLHCSQCNFCLLQVFRFSFIFF